MRFNDMRLNLLFPTLWMVFLISGCTGHFLSSGRTPDTLRADRFIIVTTSADDTFEALAGKYLKNRDKAWQIAAFNEVRSLTPGQRIVIPLVPVTLGGLQKNGYQTVPVL